MGCPLCDATRRNEILMAGTAALEDTVKVLQIKNDELFKSNKNYAARVDELEKQSAVSVLAHPSYLRVRTERDDARNVVERVRTALGDDD